MHIGYTYMYMEQCASSRRWSGNWMGLAHISTCTVIHRLGVLIIIIARMYMYYVNYYTEPHRESSHTYILRLCTHKSIINLSYLPQCPIKTNTPNHKHHRYTKSSFSLFPSLPPLSLSLLPLPPPLFLFPSSLPPSLSHIHTHIPGMSNMLYLSPS